MDDYSLRVKNCRIYMCSVRCNRNTFRQIQSGELIPSGAGCNPLHQLHPLFTSCTMKVWIEAKYSISNITWMLCWMKWRLEGTIVVLSANLRGMYATLDYIEILSDLNLDTLLWFECTCKREMMFLSFNFIQSSHVTKIMLKY